MNIYLFSFFFNYIVSSMVAVSVALLGQSASVIFSHLQYFSHGGAQSIFSWLESVYSHITNCGGSVEHRKPQAANLSKFFLFDSLYNILMLLILVVCNHNLFTVL